MPCYHMRDMMMNMATSVPQFRKALEGNGDWDEIFEGKESEVDWPASYHWRELMDVYPDAKVLLERARRRQLGAEHAEHDRPGLLRRQLMHHLVGRGTRSTRPSPHGSTCY